MSGLHCTTAIHAATEMMPELEVGTRSQAAHCPVVDYAGAQLLTDLRRDLDEQARATNVTGGSYEQALEHMETDGEARPMRMTAESALGRREVSQFLVTTGACSTLVEHPPELPMVRTWVDKDDDLHFEYDDWSRGATGCQA